MAAPRAAPSTVRPPGTAADPGRGDSPEPAVRVRLGRAQSPWQARSGTASDGWLRDDPVVEQTRIDRWLWAVRIYRTRTAATEACRGGHVEVNRSSAKPATPVRRGDRVTVRMAGRVRELEVVDLVDKRVGAQVAATCLVDHSPPLGRDAPPPPFARAPASGRPTKRDRRELDRLRRR